MGRATSIDTLGLDFCRVSHGELTSATSGTARRRRKTSITSGAALNFYFGRDRFTIEREQANALSFFASELQSGVIDWQQQNDTIADYARDSSLPFVDGSVGDARQSVAGSFAPGF
jgi:hypothetical protein